MTFPQKLFIILRVCAALVAFAFFARADELPQETNVALSIQAMQTAIRQTGVASQQFDRAFPDFAQAVAALKSQAAKSGYWEDACRSTPQCGGDSK